MKYTCPCCGYKSLDLEPPGTFTICDVCDWEDDSVQFNDPDYEGAQMDTACGSHNTDMQMDIGLNTISQNMKNTQIGNYYQSEVINAIQQIFV